MVHQCVVMKYLTLLQFFFTGSVNKYLLKNDIGPWHYYLLYKSYSAAPNEKFKFPAKVVGVFMREEEAYFDIIN